MEIKTSKTKITKEEALEFKLKGIEKNLREVFLFFASEGLIDIRKIQINEEFENNLKQKINDYLKEKNQDLNERFSELRKKGEDLGVLNFKLVMIPLKIKVFMASYNKKDAENVLRRINEIETEINKIKD